MTASAVYEGFVEHARQEPVSWSFRMRLGLAYLDLDELPGLFRGLPFASASRPGLLRFRRRDYWGDPRRPLAGCVRDAVQERLGRRPRGPVRLLTQLRQWGYGFNPASLYYCFAEDGEALEAVLVEVTNTPWGERHLYALPGPDAEGGGVRHRDVSKAFHVSPFMGMDQSYDFHLPAPGEGLSLRIDCRREGRAFFEARTAARRRPWGAASLARLLLRTPLGPAGAHARIHWEALRLWRLGAPYHRHPGASAPGPVAHPEAPRS